MISNSNFPLLSDTNSQLTSPKTPIYNCIAWAAEVFDIWWWPDKYDTYYWPPDVPREESIEAFELAFGKLGYTKCDSPALEQGFQKVAIYALGGKPTHAARQLADGNWTSKLGQSVDIQHAQPGNLNGPIYGEPILYLKRAL